MIMRRNTRSCLNTRSCFLIFALCVAVAGSLVGVSQEKATRGRKFKFSPPTARVEVLVVRASSGKPIENASVIFHQIEGREKGNMELKTNEDGKAVIDVLELGSKVRFQVIARGFQTYGEDLNLDKPSVTLEVRLSRPVEQYSAYKDHSADATKTPEGSSSPAPNPSATDGMQPNPAQSK